jgi:hypothetical protein
MKERGWRSVWSCSKRGARSRVSSAGTTTSTFDPCFGRAFRTRQCGDFVPVGTVWPFHLVAPLRASHYSPRPRGCGPLRYRVRSRRPCLALEASHPKEDDNTDHPHPKGDNLGHLHTKDDDSGHPHHVHPHPEQPSRKSKSIPGPRIRLTPALLLLVSRPPPRHHHHPHL